MKYRVNKMPLKSRWVMGFMLGALLGTTACGSDEEPPRTSRDLKIERQPLGIDQLKQTIQNGDFLSDLDEIFGFKLNSVEQQQLKQLEADYASYASRAPELKRFASDGFCTVQIEKNGFEISLLQYDRSLKAKVLSSFDLRQLEVDKEYSFFKSHCLDANWKVLRNDENEFWVIIKSSEYLQKESPANEASYEIYFSFKRPTYAYTSLEVSVTNQVFRNASGTKFLPVEKANLKMISFRDVENDEEGIANTNWKAADLQIFGKNYGMRPMKAFLNGIESEDDEDEWESSSSY